MGGTRKVQQISSDTGEARGRTISCLRVVQGLPRPEVKLILGNRGPVLTSRVGTAAGQGADGPMATTRAAQGTDRSSGVSLLCGAAREPSPRQGPRQRPSVWGRGGQACWQRGHFLVWGTSAQRTTWTPRVTLQILIRGSG